MNNRAAVPTHQRQKGVGALHPEADIRHLNHARQIVYKVLACRPGTEYGLDGFKKKLPLQNM